MNTKPIIEITNLGKKYPIVHNKLPYNTLRDSIVSFIKHPFSRHKTHESFWALKDINLTINRGDIIGIIGKNGAGKSTLLKILSGITKPTEGKIKLYGRTSSLLEVGTGFHPELTGRENIYLNGVILGMTRKEVSKKFNEIVSFAGIEKFLDTPVKHYSSGMYVRLAFAVAAHLEPDILIVDEVLAVGDIEFQKKCLGKMEEVSKEEGRTVIFVSHNIETIRQLCNKTILLDQGKISFCGNTTKSIEEYVLSQKINKYDLKSNRNNKLHITDIIFKDKNGIPNSSFESQDNIIIECKYISTDNLNKISIAICFNYLLDNTRSTSVWTSFIDKPFNIDKGYFKIVFDIPSIRLIPGEYEIIAYAEENGIEVERINNIARILINNNHLSKGVVYPKPSQGKYIEIFNFKIIKENEEDNKNNKTDNVQKS